MLYYILPHYTIPYYIIQYYTILYKIFLGPAGFSTIIAVLADSGIQAAHPGAEFCTEDGVDAPGFRGFQAQFRVWVGFELSQTLHVCK